MVTGLLVSVILVLGAISEVCGHRTIQPCGPKLCQELCQKNNCSDAIFDDVQLSCQLRMKRQCPTAHDNGISARMSTKRLRCPFNSMESFRRACDKGELLEVKRLISKGLLDVNCTFSRRERMMTLSQYATLKNKPEIFYYLMEQKCDLTATNTAKDTLLHAACSGGSLDIARKLIDDLCFDVNARSDSGITPVIYAIKHGNRDVVELLMDRGADMNIIDNNRDTILHWACFGGHADMVKYVLSLNLIDIERRGNRRRTPLMGAVCCGHINVVKLLLKHNASVTVVDRDNENVLHTACVFRQWTMFMFLFDLKELKGFEKKTDDFGETPYTMAMAGGQTVAKFLFARSK